MCIIYGIYNHIWGYENWIFCLSFFFCLSLLSSSYQQQQQFLIILIVREYGQNGDKPKRRNPKHRQEMVVLWEAFKQSFRASIVSVVYEGRDLTLFAYAKIRSLRHW